MKSLPAYNSNIVILLNSINLKAEASNATSLLENISLTQIFIGFYAFVCFILILKSIIRISKTQQIIKNNPRDEFEGQELIKVDKDTPNFSFLGKIVISNKDYNTESFRNIIAHEKVHVEQKHWIDLLLVELTTILLWFNPFAWFFERAIKQTHELLADEGVIAQDCNIGQYQTSILNQIMGVEIMGLANNFNCSITKKRMIMMTKTKSSNKRKLRLLAVIPAIAIILTFNLKCSSDNEDRVKTVEISTKSGVEKVSVKNVEMAQFPGGDKALQEWIANNVKYPDEAHKENLEGRVFIGFMVNKDGQVEDAKVLKGAAPSLNKEAVRVINIMPKWEAAKYKGENVSMSYTVPINFALQ